MSTFKTNCARRRFHEIDVIGGSSQLTEQTSLCADNSFNWQWTVPEPVEGPDCLARGLSSSAATSREDPLAMASGRNADANSAVDRNRPVTHNFHRHSIGSEWWWRGRLRL